MITTTWQAVTTELRSPKTIPTKVKPRDEADWVELDGETPTKKPQKTTKHEKRMRSDGLDLRKMYEVTTVKGRTKPRAT